MADIKFNQCLHIGGREFPLTSEVLDQIKAGGEGGTQRTRIYGVMLQLTPYEVTKIRENMKTKVYRGRRLLSTKGKYFRPRRDDESVEKYVYMRKVRPDQIAVFGPASPMSPIASDNEPPFDHQLGPDETVQKMHNHLKKAGEKIT